jgi:hypothetical protein
VPEAAVCHKCAGNQTRPRSRGGACAREGILPVSRGLRDTGMVGGGMMGGGRRFQDAGAETTAFTATHTMGATTTRAIN